VITLPVEELSLGFFSRQGRSLLTPFIVNFLSFQPLHEYSGPSRQCKGGRKPVFGKVRQYGVIIDQRRWRGVKLSNCQIAGAERDLLYSVTRGAGVGVGGRRRRRKREGGICGQQF
jgi:hypothetical protein